MYDDEQFTVTINVEVKKNREYGHGPEERITYGQEFKIRARRYAEVAKLLGNLDDAVGTIMKDPPLAQGQRNDTQQHPAANAGG